MTPKIMNDSLIHYVFADADTLANDSCQIHDDYSDSSNSTALQIYRLVVYAMVYLLGMAGNGLVIWFCIFRMKKTVNVVWILNLAITDFTFSFFLPLRMTYLALDEHWPFGKFMCKLYWFLYFLNLSVSALQLMVISVDRYICVYFPVWCKNRRRSRLAIFVATIIWIISTAFNSPYFTFQNIFSCQDKISCFNSRDKNYKWMAIVRCVCLFLVPFTIIVLCYTAITVRIKRKGFISTSRPFKIFGAVIISFFVCFFPYNLFLLLQLFGSRKFSEVNRTIKQVVMGLMIANSCMNPILYVFIGRNFKENFCTSIQAVFKKPFMEDVWKEDSKEQERRTDDKNPQQDFELDITE